MSASGGPEVEKIGEHDVVPCAEVLAGAFQDDPFQSYAIPDPRARREIARAQFQAYVRYARASGLALTTRGERLGVSLWLRPGETEPGPDHPAAADFAELTQRLGPEATSRSLRIAQWLARIRTEVAGTSFWYLMVLGVRADRRRRGIGSALVRPGLALAEADRVPCYLETVKPANRAFYEHLGFRLARDARDGASGLRVLAFLR
ncbi:MAG TPA: GNAT family N-acetyltransferase [Candidatus Polarisedimenticolaceae bacterium]|nr:GNAT family N-acetyltransferase [Candidatus Polarisedimenticolaceae bacterium]